MILLRSWPANPPANRAHVVDDIRRHVMSDFSYRELTDYQDDVLLVEWDMAFTAEDLARFKEHAAADPASVVVAPYRIYESTTRPVPLPGGPKWVHRRYVGAKESLRFVDEGEPLADLWGLGMTYLPYPVLKEFTDWYPAPGHVNDASLSGWHFDRFGPVPIAWDVRPVHLHYTIKE